MSSLLVLIGVFAISFLLGSIPWGLIISRVFYHTDIREHGSGNIGTTNAMRTMGKVGGGAVFLLDFGKGLLSGVIAMLALWFLIPGGGLSPESGVTYAFMMGAATAGCTLGHIFSPWLGFKGGKGIAVAVGCLFMSFGVAGACAELAIFAVLVLSTKYVSVGSIAAAVACPFFACAFYWGDWPAIACFALTAIVVVWAHRENIGRLRAGCERRIGDKKEEA